MIKNYFKIALRNIQRNKVFSFINIFGLAIGITCCIMLALIIHHELSFDLFHENASTIHRIRVNDVYLETGEISKAFPITTAAVGPSMKEAFPEVLDYVRFSSHRAGYFTYKDRTFREEDITHTDSTIFNVFSFDVISGNPASMLSRPNSIALTETLAKKIFGNDDPIGEVIRLDNQHDLTVTGVIKDFPTDSQLRFSSLISFISLEDWGDHFMDWDGGWNYYTYLLLDPNADIEALEAKFPDLLEENINNKYRMSGIILEMTLTPLPDIHLYSDMEWDLPTRGNLGNIYIFSAIALLILLIACMNFVNLSTARFSKRAKEVGLRKVAGATRRDLIGQFMGESVLLVMIAMIFSVIMIEIFHPWFNDLTGIRTGLYSGKGLFIPVLLAGILFFTGIIAGSYPAFFLTSFKPVNVLKGNGEIKPGSSVFRNSLVVLQFTLSIGLIGSTFVIYDQLDYIRKKDVGFRKENIIGTLLVSDKFAGNWRLIKEEVGRIPGVINVAASSAFPGRGFTSNGYLPEGYETVQMFNALEADSDYFETMGMEIIAGRNFSADLSTDEKKYIINQALAAQVGWNDPPGKIINRNGDHEVIGVVGDFHFATMHHRISPLIISVSPREDRFEYLNIRVRDDDKAMVIEKLNEIWNEFDQHEPFYYFFVEDLLDGLYGSESKMGQVFTLFASLAVIIAGMGLFGLASFLTGQRTREIAIRKVHGAPAIRILVMLNSGFVKWVVISAILSIPVSWFLMQRWLQNFEYHIVISPLTYLYAFLITLAISVLTVSYQTLSAARINAANALKYE
jgi:putative ABC transport system permease protein